MAYIIPGRPPREPGLFTRQGVADSLARAQQARSRPSLVRARSTTRTQREAAEQAVWQGLLARSDAREAMCATHPIPAPYPNPFYPEETVIPDRCTCYLESPECRAMMAWQSNFCNLCGSEGLCLPGCEAIDARHEIQEWEGR